MRGCADDGGASTDTLGCRKYGHTDRAAGVLHRVSHLDWRVVALAGKLISGEDNGQQLLAFVEWDKKAGKSITGYEYAVLVTNTDYEILSLGQKSLRDNWWSLFVRLVNPEARREAITSRPWLMSSVGRRTEHAGQTTIALTSLHAHFGKARAALIRVSALLKGWVAVAAEQLNSTTVWSLVCDHLKHVPPGLLLRQRSNYSKIMHMESGNCGF